MYKSGLLLLTNPVNKLRTTLPEVFDNITRHVNGTLYVLIQPGLNPNALSQKTAFPSHPYSESIRKSFIEVYRHSNLLRGIDTKLIISNIHHDCPEPPKLTHAPYHYIFLDQEVGEVSAANIKAYLGKGSSGSEVDVIGIQTAAGDTDPCEDQPIKTYKHVCVGGTFDRLHLGHKMLLTETCALAEEIVTVGVTDQTMNQRKVLNELIQPTQQRIEALRAFVQEIRPNVQYNIVAISDMYGPTITVEDMDCLVVSEETKNGGAMVNDKRREKGMQEVDIHCIELVEDAERSQYEETKVSSSSTRKRLLGTLLRPSLVPENKSPKPYVIGLTGGIASGKSSVAKRLQGMGAHIIDCDKLGHKAYLKGSKAFNQVVETFGTEVVGDDGEINRKALGPKVFADKGELKKLNNIVWPAIAEMCLAEISELRENGAEIVVLDAAVLLEAGWQTYVHEIWSTLVPRDEAIKRIIERNGLPEDAAAKRVDSQTPNKEKVDRANVIICTLWEYEYTQQQVEKAWELLKERMKENSQTASKM